MWKFLNNCFVANEQLPLVQRQLPLLHHLGGIFASDHLANDWMHLFKKPFK